MRNTLILAILILSLILGSATLTRGHEWGDDFAEYIMQAKSILNGKTQEFVEHNTFTISESSFLIGPAAYPWGYPLILTPAYAIKGNNPLVLKLPGLFFFAGFLVCLYLLARTHLTEAESLLILGLFAFNPVLLRFLDQILSDIPFLFFSTLALFLMINEYRRSRLVYALLGAVIAFTFFIRSTGILLLGSFLIIETFKLWRNRTNHEAAKKTLSDILIVCATFGLLWGIYALFDPGSQESYVAQFQIFRLEAVPRFIIGNLQLIGVFFGETGIWKYIYYVLFIFFLIGLWVRRKEEPVLIVFFSLWMIVLITWQYWQGPRYIFPLLPIFMYFTFQGMKTAILKLPEKYHQAGRGVFYGFWLLIAAIFLVNSTLNAYNNLRNNRTINGPYDPVSMGVYSYLKDKTSPDSVVVFFKPRAMRLMTDHDTLMINQCEGLPKGDYIVLSKKVGGTYQVPPERIGACNLPQDK